MSFHTEPELPPEAEDFEDSDQQQSTDETDATAFKPIPLTPKPVAKTPEEDTQRQIRELSDKLQYLMQKHNANNPPSTPTGDSLCCPEHVMKFRSPPGLNNLSTLSFTEIPRTLEFHPRKWTNEEKEKEYNRNVFTKTPPALNVPLIEKINTRAAELSTQGSPKVSEKVPPVSEKVPPVFENVEDVKREIKRRAEARQSPSVSPPKQVRSAEDELHPNEPNWIIPTDKDWLVYQKGTPGLTIAWYDLDRNMDTSWKKAGRRGLGNTEILRNTYVRCRTHYDPYLPYNTIDRRILSNVELQRLGEELPGGFTQVRGNHTVLIQMPWRRNEFYEAKHYVDLDVRVRANFLVKQVRFLVIEEDFAQVIMGAPFCASRFSRTRADDRSIFLRDGNRELEIPSTRQHGHVRAHVLTKEEIEQYERGDE